MNLNMNMKIEDVHLFSGITSAFLFILAGSLYITHSPLLSKIKQEKKGQLRNEKLKIELVFLSDLLDSISVEHKLRGNNKFFVSIIGMWHLDSHLCTESCNSHARVQ